MPLTRCPLVDACDCGYLVRRSVLGINAPEFASSAPTMAAASRKPIAPGFLSLSLPPRKIRAPGWGCGCRMALSASMGGRSRFAVAPRMAETGQFSRYFFLKTWSRRPERSPLPKGWPRTSKATHSQDTNHCGAYTYKRSVPKGQYLRYSVLLTRPTV